MSCMLSKRKYFLILDGFTVKVEKAVFSETLDFEYVKQNSLGFLKRFFF